MKEKKAQETIAKIYLDLKMYEEAVFEYQVALDLNIKSFSCYLGLGKAALRSKKYELACNSFKQAIKLSKKDKESYLKLLESYICLSNFKKALKTLKKINKIISFDEIAEYKAYIYVKQEKYQEAIKEYLTIEKISWQKHNNLGFCYLKINQKEKAIYELKKSLELNPNQSDIVEKIKELEN
ncbi:MAG: tetratricopeptide repeat protein [bacterium]